MEPKLFFVEFAYQVCTCLILNLNIETTTARKARLNGNGLIPLSLLLSIYALRKSKHSVFDIIYSMLAVKIDLDTSRVYRDLCYSIFF